MAELNVGEEWGACCKREAGQRQKEGTSVNKTGFGLGMEAGPEEHGGSWVDLGKGLFVTELGV